MVAAEAALPGYMPTPGTFSAANSGGYFDVAPTGSVTFLIHMRQPGGAYTLFDTVTVSAAGVAHAFAASAGGPNPYPGPAYFKCEPPALADPTLEGLVIFLGGP